MTVTATKLDRIVVLYCLYNSGSASVLYRTVFELIPVKAKAFNAFISRTVGDKNLKFRQKKTFMIPIGLWALMIDILTLSEL